MRARGFTLVELVVTLALVALVALVALPLYEVTSTRLRETELRAALRSLRTALDDYKRATETGQIAKDAASSGYPVSLEILVRGVEAAQNNTTGTNRVVFLRQIPRDPFAPDPTLAPAEQWRTRAYGSPPDDPQPGADVFDVASRSDRVGSNGVPYGQW